MLVWGSVQGTGLRALRVALFKINPMQRQLAVGSPSKLTWSPTWAFPKIRGTILGVAILRTIVFWGLYWGPPIWEPTICTIV